MKHSKFLKHTTTAKAFYFSSLLWALSGPQAVWAGTLHHPQESEPRAAHSALLPAQARLALVEQGSEQLQRAQTHKALMAALNQQVDQVSRLASEMARARDELTHALASGDEHYVALSQQSLDSYRQAFYQAQVALRTRMKELQRFHAQEQAVN